MAAALGGERGVGLAMDDALGGNAEVARQDLRHHGLVAGAGGFGAERKRQPAVVLDPHIDAFEALAAGQPEIVGEATAAAPAPRPGLGGARGETVPVGQRQGPVEHRLEVAAVDLDADLGAVGHVLGADQVAPA